MLSKFRQNFPTSSLTSELLQIREGVCYVQCRIVDDSNDAFLSAIASGSTVEIAEDAARLRVLELFFAGEKTDTPNEYGSPEEKASFSILAERPSDELLAEFKEAIAVEPPVLIPCEQPTPKKRSQKKKEPEPVETVVETAIAEPEIVEPTLPEKEEVSNAIAEPENIEPILPEKEEDKPSPEPQLVQESLLPETPQLEFDFSDLIAKTNQHLARLNWTADQGKNHLIKTYNKRSRQLLTDEELFDFLNYLESQPDPS